MMLLDFLRSRPRRTLAVVSGLLVVLIFAGLFGIATSDELTDSARLALFVVLGGFSLVGAALSYVVARGTRELGRLRAREVESAEELARRGERLRLLAENAGDMIYRYRLSPNRGFEYVSPAATALTGFTPEEHYADPDLVLKLVHPDDRHLLEKALHRPEAPLVLRWRRGDGSIVWTEQRNKYVHDKAGNPVAIEGIARDITEAKHAEDQRRESESLARSTIDSLSAHIAILDASGAVIAVNRAWTEFAERNSGHRESVGVGANYLRVCDSVRGSGAGVAAAFAEGIRDVIAGRETYFEMEYPCHSPTENRWFVGRVTRFSAEEALDTAPRVVVAHEDVTNRKENEEALREGEERYRATFENAAVGVAHFDLDGAFARVNSKLCEMVGYTREELLATDWMSISHPAEIDLNLELRERHLKGETGSYSLEKRYIHKQGHEVWVELTANLQRDENGKPLYYIAFIEDVSGRKKAEEALRESEERLRLALEAASLGLWYQDLKTGEFMAAPQTAAMHGLEPNTPLDQEKALALVHHEDRGRVGELVERAVAARGPYEAEYRIVWPDGTVRWMASRARIYGESDDDSDGRMIGIVQDITRRKQAEQSLLLQAQLLDQVQAGVIATDMDGKVIHWNRHAETLYGWTRQEVLDRNILDLTVGPEDAKVAEEIMAQLQSGQPWEGEFITRRKDGSLFPAYVSDALVYDENGNPAGLVGVSVDITERKKNEEAIREREERLNAILQNTTAVIYLMSPESRFMHINRCFEELFGLNNAAVRGRSVHDVFPAEIAASFESNNQRVLAAGAPIEFEELAPHSDGMHTYASIKAPLFDAAGEPRGVVGISTDITERKRAEEALRESEERFRAAFDSAATGMALTSPEGRWLQVNRSICEITGYAEEELLGADFQSITHPEDLREDLEGMRRLLGGEIPYHYAEKRFLHKSGHPVWVLLSASLVRDADGEPLYFVVQAQDITGSKRDKENLERLSRHNDMILKSAGEGIFGLDLQERITFVNPAAETLLGHDAGELIGRHQHDIIHHSHPDGTPYSPEDCPIYAALRDGDVRASSDEVFWRKDGTSFPVEYVSTPIRQEGEVVGAVVTFSEITERKRAEEALRDSEERFRLLAENTSDLVCLHEPDGRYIYISPSCRRLLGYEPAELLGADPYGLFHPDDAPRIRSESHERVLEGTSPASVTYRIRKKSGEYLWFETLTEPIQDENGDVVRLQTASRDVTDRKRVEDALQESEERLRMAVQVSPLALFRQDCDLRYTWVHNPQLGFGTEPAVGKTDLELLPREDAERLTEIKRRVLATGTGVREEVRTTADDAFYYDLTVEPLRDSVGDIVGLSGAAVDITERKRVEEAVAAAARARADFLAEVSHELRTPLTVIRGNAEVGLDLKRGCVHDEVLKEIVAESTTMSRMVEDLLFLARSDTSTPIFRPRTVSTEAFLAALAGRAALVVQERGATLETNLSGAGETRMDPMRVEQAVLALVDNAAKYGRDRVTLTSSTENGELRITVADNGPGIPEEHLPRVFERFYRVDHTHEQGGAGLGLSIVSTITEAHGGRMEAESRPGKGTRISLYLPLSGSHNDAAREPLAGETGG